MKERQPPPNSCYLCGIVLYRDKTWPVFRSHVHVVAAGTMGHPIGSQPDLVRVWELKRGPCAGLASPIPFQTRTPHMTSPAQSHCHPIGDLEKRAYGKRRFGNRHPPHTGYGDTSHIVTKHGERLHHSRRHTPEPIWPVGRHAQ